MANDGAPLADYGNNRLTIGIGGEMVSAVNEIMYKGCADLILETCSVIKSLKGKTVGVGNGASAPDIACRAIGEYDEVNGSNLIETLDNNCSIALKLVKQISIPERYRINFEQSLNLLKASCLIKELKNPINTYVVSNFTDLALGRVDDLGHILSDENLSLGRRIHKDEIRQCVSDLNLAFQGLQVPAHISVAIRSEIEKILSIIDQIETNGTEDLWDRMWKLSTYIEASAQGSETEGATRARIVVGKWSKIIFIASIAFGSFNTGASMIQYAQFAGISNPQDLRSIISSEIKEIRKLAAPVAP